MGVETIPPAGSGTLCPGSSQGAGYGQCASPGYRRSGRARQTGQARNAVLLPARQCLSHFWHKGNDRRRLQKRSERGQKEAWKKPGNRSGQDRTGRFCQCLMPCERLSAKETFGLSKEEALRKEALRKAPLQQRAFARDLVSADRRNRHTGALPGKMSEGLRKKKTGHEIWPRVCLKTGAQALLLLSGRHVCSPWQGYGPAFSATVTCSFFQMAFRHSPLFLSRGLED